MNGPTETHFPLCALALFDEVLDEKQLPSDSVAGGPFPRCFWIDLGRCCFGVPGGAAQLQAQITLVNNFYNGTAGTPWSGTSGPYTEAITPSASADVLVVTVGERNSGGSNATPTVTFDGLAMTGSVWQPSLNTVYTSAGVFYLYEPAAGWGSGAGLRVTFSGTASDSAVSAYALGGVNISNSPVVITATGDNEGDAAPTTVTATLAGVAPGSYIATDETLRIGTGPVTTTVTGGTLNTSTTAGVHGNFWAVQTTDLYAAGALVSTAAGGTVTIEGSAPDPESLTGSGSHFLIAAAAFAPLGHPALAWSGLTSNSWSLASGDVNWSSMGGDTFYSNGSAVTFSNAGVNTNPIAIVSSGVQPASVTFTNATTPYSFSGGAMSGTGSVALDAAGSVMFLSVNTYTGSTTITPGTLTLSGPGAINGTSSIAVGNGGTGALMIQGQGQLQTSVENVGLSGTGSVTQSGGVNTTSGYLDLGASAGDSGTYILTGNGYLSVLNNENVGSSGTGIFTQSGGTNSCSDFNLGNGTGSSGTYSLGGGYLSVAGSENVGYSGTGIFLHSGGTNMSNYLNLGNNAGSSGTYSLGGNGDVAVTENENLGYAGTGAFTQTGGTNRIGNALYLGTQPGGFGVYNLSGSGYLPVAGNEYVGYSGPGAFTQTGGSNNLGYGSLYVGYGSGSSGNYTQSGGMNSVNFGYLYLGYGGSSGNYSLSGSAMLSTAYGEYVGYSGTGTFTQSGGTNSVNFGGLYLGYGGGSGGNYSLSGSAMLSTAYGEYVGNLGTFTQSGGTNNVGGTLTLDSGSGSSTYILSGSGLLSAGNEYAGYFGSGAFAQVRWDEQRRRRRPLPRLFLRFQRQLWSQRLGGARCRQRIHRLLRRRRHVQSIGRIEHGRLRQHRQFGHLSVQRRHTPSRRRTCQSRCPRRHGRHGGADGRRQCDYRPLAGVARQHGLHDAQHRPQLASPGARRLQSVSRLWQLRQRGSAPQRRHSLDGVARPGLFRQRLAGRPRVLPGSDSGGARQRGQSQRRHHGFRDGQRQLGDLRDFHRERHAVGRQRRVARGIRRLCRLLRHGHVYAVRRSE